MKIEELLTKKEKNLIADTIDWMLEGGEVRPIVLMGLAMYALDFMAHDAEQQVKSLPDRIYALKDDLADTQSEKDPLFDEAHHVAALRGSGKNINVNHLRKSLRIPYARASALINQLEAAGVISPKDGAKPREVLSRGVMKNRDVCCKKCEFGGIHPDKTHFYLNCGNIDCECHTPPTPEVSTDVERLSSDFHAIYQKEAQRQDKDVMRWSDRYEDLPENIKEFDRVLARYVISLLTNERNINWNCNRISIDLVCI